MQPLVECFHWKNTFEVAPKLINATRYDTNSPKRCSGRIEHNTWVLDYSCMSGCQIRVGGIHAPWRFRDQHVAHLYPPHTPYWEDTRGAERFYGAYILFTGGESTGLLQKINHTPYARFADPQRRLQKLLFSVSTVGQIGGDRVFWEAQGYFCRIMQLLLNAIPQKEGDWRIAENEYEKRSDESDFVERTNQFLREHLTEPVTLNDLAKHLHVSRSSLAHRYRKETGEPPLQHLNRLRVEFATGLLLRGLRLDEIAQQTGFCDAFHFSKTFKRIMGRSPRVYRDEFNGD